LSSQPIRREYRSQYGSQLTSAENQTKEIIKNIINFVQLIDIKHTSDKECLHVDLFTLAWRIIATDTGLVRLVPGSSWKKELPEIVGCCKV